ncbi:MAG: hypothetical protein JXR96_18820 [Deltaproteobacteria bacterium]|nr:hypothetical protein [Deltaproteobacteria bacterium]
MNYFLSVYELALAPLLILIFGIGLVVLFLNLWRLAYKLRKRELEWTWRTLGSSVFASLLITMALMYYLPCLIIDGKIHRVFHLTRGGQERLVVWHTRIAEAASGDYCTNRLKSYDIATGELLGSTLLNWRYDSCEYRIYGPFEDGKAWGYSRQNGVRFLDLFAARVLADEEAILKRIPELGGAIRPAPRDRFDLGSSGLRVVGNSGGIYSLTPDLKAVPASGGSKRSGRGAARESRWVIGEREPGQESKIPLVYLDANDKAQMRLDLEHDGPGEAEPLEVFEGGGGLYVFMSRERYTLYALKVDPESGELGGRIEYFE